MTTVKALAYWIGFAALTCGTFPAADFLHSIGASFHLIIFIWLVLAGAFSWSVAAWMIRGRHW